MKLQLVRHATLLLDYAGMKILVDPMLSEAGAMSAIQNSPQPRPNPLVPLPFPVEQVLDGVQLVLVTHRIATTGTMRRSSLCPKTCRCCASRKTCRRWKRCIL